MSPIDLATIVLYAGLVLGVGWSASRRHQTAQDFHLGGRDLPLPALLASLTATELSAATFIGVPQAAFLGDWSYLQFAFGALLGKCLVAVAVIPIYYRAGVVTVYGFLAERFGDRSRRSAALCFVGGRILASGVRLFIAALALSTATGWSLETGIVASGLVAGLYTLFGGIRAVVWTDTLQAAVFLAGAGAVILVIVSAAPAGFDSLLGFATEGSRTRVFHFEPLLSLARTNLFGVGLLGGFFLTLATHATDHDMVQRLLCARSGRAGSWTLALSGLINFPVTALFLLVGTAIAFHYEGQAPAYSIEEARRVVPLFALHEMPDGLRGLVFAGLFAAAMSSLDSAICALSTTFSVDVLGHGANERQLVRRTRIGTAAFTTLIVLAAIAMASYQRYLDALPPAADGVVLSLVEFALSSMTVLYGGLLGVFAWALWGRESRDAAGVVALGVGATTGLLLFLQPLLLGHLVISWPFWIPISSSLTLATLFVASRLGSPEPPTRRMPP